MIAVIADDFTGAAEMAGIGLRYGLKAAITLRGNTTTDADLLVICTGSRSLNNAEAQKVTAAAVNAILKLKPNLIYKKIDSVFRGHVPDELETQLQQTGLQKALVVAANPSLGRTIKDGRYFIHDKPINETGFANDPEFAISDASVLNMLKATGKMQVLKHTAELPNEGIVIGEAASNEEVTAWAGINTSDWVLAGAGDFFTALLAKRYSAITRPAVEIELPHLYVSGTAFDQRKAFIKEAERKLNCVAYLTLRSEDDEMWLYYANNILKSQKRLIVAIDEAGNNAALTLRMNMAKMVKRVIESGEVKELFVEGGSTAGAILEELQLKTFYPVNELGRGVVRMKVKDWFITVKPGSYKLPEQVEQLYSPF